MMSYSNKIYDRLPTTFFVTQYMTRVLEVSSGSEFYCLKKYYVVFNENTMNQTKLSINYINLVQFYFMI